MSIEGVFNFLAEHWDIVLVVVGALIALANLATRYWADCSGVRRWVGFVTEALGIFTSLGARTTSQPLLGRLKFPGQFVPPSKAAPPSSGPGAVVALLVGLSLLCSACSTWQVTTARSLNVAKATVDVTRSTAAKVLHDKCLAVAQQCTVAGKQCAALQACWKTRASFNGIIKAIYRSLDGARVAFVAAVAVDGVNGLKAKALALATSVLAELVTLERHARELGVL